MLKCTRIGLWFAIVFLAGADGAMGQASPWREVDAGLFVGEFVSLVESEMGDSRITVVKIDPTHYSLKLVAASERGRIRRTAKEWCEAETLIAAINAGMFQQNGITSVGYMKNFSHTNNARVNEYKAVLAFNPASKAVPEIQIIDRVCHNFDELRGKYHSLVQNLRMIDCKRRNVWGKSDKKWSTAAVGTDQSGNVLFLFTRSPYPVRDFINILLSLPISIAQAVYCEGGPEASLYLSHKGVEIEKFGSYETGFNENDYNDHAWPIPNVIGVVKKNRDL